MQISIDVIGLKKSLSQAQKYHRGLNRLSQNRVIAIELKSSRGTLGSIAIELKIDGQRALSQ